MTQPRPVGRPPLRRGEPTQTLSVRLPASMVAAIDAARGETVTSTWVRAAIEAALGGAPAPPRVWLLYVGSEVVSVHRTREAARARGLELKAQGYSPEMEEREIC